MTTTAAPTSHEEQDPIHRRVLGRGFKPGTWNVSEVVPGEPCQMRAHMNRGVKPDEISELPAVEFAVFAEARWRELKKVEPIKDSGGAPVRVPGSYQDDGEGGVVAVADWTPDVEVASMPPSLVFVPIAEGLGTNASAAVPAAQAWIVECRWVPGEALVGDEVRLEARLHGFAGSEVAFKVFYAPSNVRVALSEGEVTGEPDPDRPEENGKRWFVACWEVPTPDVFQQEREDAGIEEPTDEERAEARQQLADAGVPAEAAAEELFRPRVYTLELDLTAGEGDEQLFDDKAATLHATEKRFFLSL